MERAGYEYVKICKEKLGTAPPWINEMVVSFTDFPTLRPVFVSEFASPESFARAIRASSYVPFVMGFRPWCWLPEARRRVFDGYLGLWRAQLPDNYMYVSFLPTMPKSALAGKHFLAAYEYDRTPENIFVRFWPWADPNWADAAFERGRKDFIDAGSELQGQILAFLRS